LGLKGQTSRSQHTMTQKSGECNIFVTVGDILIKFLRQKVTVTAGIGT